MSNYRNPKLLKAAKDAPVCMCCGKHNGGDVVAAHSNQLKDGKGRGLKAHDYRIAYLCTKCHHDIDEGTRMLKAEKVAVWDECHRKSIGWLFESGKVIAV